MSKKGFNVDIGDFNKTTDMDSIYAGITTPTPVKEDKPNTINKTSVNKVKTNKANDVIIDHTKTIDSKGRINKKNNFTITIKIDEDIKDYLNNILWINRKTKNQYINDLIREDMYKRLKLKENTTYEQLQTEWENYKKANNI